MTSIRISDHLRYTTVRVLTSKNQTINWTGTGTGFLYCFNKKGKTMPFLVTNKHVVDGSYTIGLIFHVATNNNERPLHGAGRLISFLSRQVPIIRHPDPVVDLAAIAIEPIINYANQEGWCPYIRGFDKSNLPSEQMISDFSALEDVIMMGYPTGLADEANNFPIARRGITSTPYAENYRGNREFLADIPVYGGSSGSPIFVLTEGSWLTSSASLMAGTRFALIGVLYAGHTETVNGQIVAEPVPTSCAPVAKFTHIINLGLCIKSALIEDLATQIPDW